MWGFYILAGVLTAGVAVKLMHPLMKAGDREAARVLMMLVPALALVVYVPIGRPDLPGRHRVFEKPGEVNTLHAALLSRKPYEERLAADPDDLGALMMLGQIDTSLGNLRQAVKFLSRAVEVSRNDMRHRAIVIVLGETQVAANGGKVGDDAKETFEYVLRLHPVNPIARYYLALWKAQNGRPEEALSEWRALLASGNPEIYWKQRVREKIAETKMSMKK